MNHLPETSGTLSRPIAAAWSVGPVLLGIAFALLMHLAIVPSIDEPYYATVLLHIGINIILAVSLNIVNGFTGQFSIGHAGFMAVGGYTAAAITYYGYGSAALWGDQALQAGLLSWSRNPSDFEGPFLASGDLLFLGACLAGGLTAAVAGLVVGLPSLRLRGDYLAIVTLGFGEIVRVLLEQSKPQVFSAEEVENTATPALLTHLGGALGMTNLPFYTTPFWVYLFVAATLLTAYRIRQSTHGRAFLSIREDALAAETMGVPVTRYKVIAFVISAFFAGIAGALFAHMLGVSLNPGELGFQKSFDVLIMVVLGGLGSISGSVLAAVILTILPELLRQPPHVWHVGLALAIALLIFGGKKLLRPALLLAAFVIGWEALRAGAIHFEIDLSRYRLILYALALVLTMIVRPQGLFGLHEAWELWPGSAGVHARLSRMRRGAGVDARVLPGEVAVADDPLLYLENVSLSFSGLKAVTDFGLELRPGDLHGLIGPNGAGKTTVFNLVTGIYRPDSGRIDLAGRSLTGLPAWKIARRGVTRTFQNVRLFKDLSVLDNVRQACHLRARHTLPETVLRFGRFFAGERAITDRARELLDVMGLLDRERELARNLPYGDQRRLEIARALATGPKVLLLDEPAAGMNSSEKIALALLIRELGKRFGVTILLIDHDMGLVMSICERITVLDHGQVIAHGTPGEIQSDPEVIRAYLGDPLNTGD